jgi:tripeptide aminopeptidase
VISAVGAGTGTRASQAERERLHADFVALCGIESPSLRERSVADAVIAGLEAAGLEVEEDSSAAIVGSDAGNLLARIPGPEGAPAVLLCAHLDTVPLAGPVEVVCEGGAYFNRHEAILGADNKAAVAVLLAVARRLVGDVRDGGAPSQGPGGDRVSPPVGVELLFTTAEELGLRGAKEVERAALASDFGFVFDHASPIGELILAAPSYFRLEAHFHGASAHAGIRPQDGHNAIAAAARAIAAMRLGRLDDATTANVGVIEGGSAANVVAERCRVELEARSLDDAVASQLVGEMVDACSEAASEAKCDVECVVEQLFRAYRLPRSAPQVRVASGALEALGIEPSYVTTGGGSDANALIAAGLPMLNIANGTEGNHQPDERVTVEALETALDLALALLDHCHDPVAPESG